MRLVCTDLDRTLLPNGEQPESVHARPILWQLLSGYSMMLAYVSGRDLQRVVDAIDEYQLPTPDFIVADVGTSLHIREGDRWVRNIEWQTMASDDWNGYDSRGIREILKELPLLENQEDERQSGFKRSYYYPESADEAKLIDSINALLISRQIKASVVVSHDPVKSLGLLDILPRTATKREAVSHIQKLCQLPAADVMFAGDSGNDVLAICAQQPSVLVANADAATTKAVKDALKHSPHLATTHFAKGGLGVAGFGALNGNYSAGIIEGLTHFRPQWLEHLSDAKWVSMAMHQAAANSKTSPQRTA